MSNCCMCVQDLSWNQTLKEHHTENRSRKSAKIRHAFKAFCSSFRCISVECQRFQDWEGRSKLYGASLSAPGGLALWIFMVESLVFIKSSAWCVISLEQELLALGCLLTFSMTFTSVALNIIQSTFTAKRNFFLFLKIRSRKLFSYFWV